MPYSKHPGLLDLFDVRRLVPLAKRGPDLATRVGFLMLSALMATSALVNFHQTQVLRDSEEAVSRSHVIVRKVVTVLGSLTDAETGSRGFVLSQNKEFLEPYYQSAPMIEEHFKSLKELTRDMPAHHAAIERLEVAAYSRLEHLDQVVAAGLQGDVELARSIIRTGEGRRRMDAVREIIAGIELVELDLLGEREGAAQVAYRTAQGTGIAVGMASVLLVLVVYNLVLRYDGLRARAAQHIADARARFEGALASIGDAVIVVDTDNRLVYCNEGSRALLGLGKEDFGRSIDQAIALQSEAFGTPIDLTALASRPIGEIAHAASGTVLSRQDGTIVPVEVTAARLGGERGEWQGAIYVLLDVSKRRQIERDLARSSQRFRLLVVATSQVVWTANERGKMVEDAVAWRALTGQSYEQWQGDGWLDALHPDDRQRIEAGWRKAVAQGQPFADEYRLRTADGQYLWSYVRAVPVLDIDGVLREWVGMTHDIHARKLAEASVIEASRHKDEFIALLSHELRNPLAPLSYGLELLKSGNASENGRAIALMDRQLRHMMRLINDLLDLSRIGQGRLELQLGGVDLVEVARQAVEDLAPSASAKGQRLDVSLPAHPLWVRGDAARLAQVVSNLLSNAIKYSDAGAHIWLTAEFEGSEHVLRVRDTGQGIEPELQSRIWNLFMQGRGRAERIGGGLGIGLMLVRRIVELHGGSVAVSSDGAGTGSEFTVRVPSFAQPPRAQPAQRAHPRPALRALDILVIDDNQDSTESLAMLLRAGGHRVRTSLSGEAGIAEYLRNQPELVLCDIHMPDLSGHEVARRLRALPGGASCALVALTGFGTQADRESSAEAGFERHLVKPVDPDELFEILHEISERAPRA
jgi:PAS domain S-box-containing protein